MWTRLTYMNWIDLFYSIFHINKKIVKIYIYFSILIKFDRTNLHLFQAVVVYYQFCLWYWVLSLWLFQVSITTLSLSPKIGKWSFFINRWEKYANKTLYLFVNKFWMGHRVILLAIGSTTLAESSLISS